MNKTVQMIEVYGSLFDPEYDITTKEAKEIINSSETKMEIVSNSYLLGFMNGSRENAGKRMVPVYDLPQISDERWNQLARQYSLERMCG